MLLVRLGHTKHCSIYVNIFTFEFFGDKNEWCSKPNTPHSPPVCTMFKEIAKYLKVFGFFHSITIMKSASWWWRHRQNFARYLEGFDLNLGYTPDCRKILRLINALNPHKAHGHDAISIRMVKWYYLAITRPLSIIYKNFLQQGAFPDEWKKENIIPVHTQKNPLSK